MEVEVYKKELENSNPFENETIIDDSKDVFTITRYFIGTKNLVDVFEEILQNHDDLKDKVS
jgi:hypothetical protein